MARRPSGSLANAVAPGVRVPKIEPLQTRITRNRWRFLAFMVAFTTAVAVSLFVFAVLVIAVVALFLGAASEWSFQQGPDVALAVVGFVFTASLALSWIWAIYAFSRSEAWLMNRLGARVAKAGDLLPTKQVLRDMAIAGGLPKTPQLYVIDTPGVNAFALGRTESTVRIGITTGMLERISAREQRAVFANLIARIISQDTRWATAVSALMGPIWAMREYDLRMDPRVREQSDGSKQTDDWRASGLLVYGVAVIITEVLAWYHQEAAWKAAEKADAEGMMLLKDPQAMLDAIEHVLERNNHVPTAGDAYSQLFFCWAGWGFAPDDDPEMRRVARLRETLGAEGAAYIPRPNVPAWDHPPVAPRMELLAGAHADRLERAE